MDFTDEQCRQLITLLHQYHREFKLSSDSIFDLLNDLSESQDHNDDRGRVDDYVHELQAHLESLDRNGPEGEVADFSLVVDMVTKELVDMAFSGNLQRRHHLESATAAFANIETLLQAERIVRDLLLDEVEGPADDAVQ
jgi:hypothetical protein